MARVIFVEGTKKASKLSIGQIVFWAAVVIAFGVFVMRPDLIVWP